VLAAPAIIDFLNLQFRQIAILRYGALGSVFQFVFIAATSILLFFDRRRTFIALQLMFLGLNLGLSLATVAVGEDTYGIGYFLACALSGFTAYILADRTFRNLNYLTFIGNNPSVKAATSTPRRRPPGLPGMLAEVVRALTSQAPRS